MDAEGSGAGGDAADAGEQQPAPQREAGSAEPAAAPACAAPEAVTPLAGCDSAASLPLDAAPSDAAAAGADAGAVVDAAAHVADLLRRLASGDAAEQLAAAEGVAALCTGKRDEPDDSAACAALLDQDAVPALLRLVDASAPAQDARCAALHALAALTDVHEPARSVVVDADGLPVLAAALTHADDGRVALGAARVLWYTSRVVSLKVKIRTSGALDALLGVVRRAAERSVGSISSANDAVVAALCAVHNCCISPCEANMPAVCDAGVIPCLVALLREDTSVDCIKKAASLLQLLAASSDEACISAVTEAGAADALQALLPPSPVWALVIEKVLPALRAIDKERLPSCVPQLVEQLAAPDAAAQLKKAVLGTLRGLSNNRIGKAVARKAGAIPAIVALMAFDAEQDVQRDCCSSIWSIAEDCAKNAEEVRACGGIKSLLRVVVRTSELNSDVMKAAVGALMTLANNDALHAALVAEDVLRLVTPVIRGTARDETRLEGLLLIACVYSGRSDPDADALLAEFDVTQHLRSMLVAVQGGRPGSYLHVKWSVRETTLYARTMAVDRSRAERLAASGVPQLLVALLPCTDDVMVHQHVCRALRNFTYVESLLPLLRDAGVVAAVKPYAASSDDMTADAAKGVLLAFGELQDAAAQGAANAAESSTAAMSDVRAAGGIPSSALPRFNVFLSHKRTDAKDFARGLYNLLLLRGVTSFLDFEYREELNDLEHVVAACDNLIFILTDNVFDSPWCLLELAAAARAGVNIVLVRKEGARWADASGHRTAEHPPAFLIDQLDEAVRKPLFSCKAIAHSDEYYKAFCDTLVGRLVTPEAAAASRARAAAAQSLGAARHAPTGTVHSAGGAPPATPQSHAASGGDRSAAGSATPAPSAPTRTLSHPPLPTTPQQPLAAAPAASWEHERLASEVAHLREELKDVCRELRELRRGNASPQPGAHQALVLPLAAMSTVGVTCCVAMLLVSLQAAHARRA